MENDAKRLDPMVFAVGAGALRKADAKVTVEIGKRLVGAGLLLVALGGAIEFESAISVGEVDANADVEFVMMVAVVKFGLLGAVVHRAAAGGFEDLKIGRVDFDLGDVRAGIGRGENTEIGSKSSSGVFVVVLAEEVGIADGFGGEGESKAVEGDGSKKRPARAK